MYSLYVDVIGIAADFNSDSDYVKRPKRERVLVMMKV